MKHDAKNRYRDEQRILHMLQSLERIRRCKRKEV